MGSVSAVSSEQLQTRAVSAAVSPSSSWMTSPVWQSWAVDDLSDAVHLIGDGLAVTESAQVRTWGRPSKAGRPLAILERASW